MTPRPRPHRHFCGIARMIEPGRRASCSNGGAVVSAPGFIGGFGDWGSSEPPLRPVENSQQMLGLLTQHFAVDRRISVLCAAVFPQAEGFPEPACRRIEFMTNQPARGREICRDAASAAIGASCYSSMTQPARQFRGGAPNEDRNRGHGYPERCVSHRGHSQCPTAACRACG